MSLPTESQWVQYSALCARLQAVPASERSAVLQALRAEGNENLQVLSLVALHWALPPDPTRDRTGDRLGDFTLEEPLGAGGMGVVYRAQQHIGATTRLVAVKLIHPTLLQTAREEALSRFQAEMDTLVKLEHEGIARIYGGGVAEDPRTHEPVPYLAMELVRGGQPITTYARDYALSWEECLVLFLHVCRAVQYAHEHRVIHRDLKPANILVDREGNPFVIDFGLAHAFDALLPGAHLAASGTPAYMSPEQVSDALGPLSAKTDVYALGLILYELLTAQPPYTLPRDGTFTQWCQVITEAPPPPLHQYREVYGGELEEIMAAALAKRSADRVRVDVLRSRLERYLKKFPLDRDRPLYEPGKLPRDIQPVSRHNDRVIAPVEIRQRAQAGERLPTAPDAPIAAERHDLGQADRGSPPDPVQPAPPSPAPPVQVTSSALHAAEHDTSEAEYPLSIPVLPLAQVPDGAAHAAEQESFEDERRQLTVLSCALVDATALATRLDPEDLLEVMRAYQAVCAEIVQRFDGHITQFLGDGLLVYFGFPQAHEDDAQRAVRTGLEIVTALRQLNARLTREQGVRLAVRVGIHTGLVVVGKMGSGGRQEQLVLGDTPNSAARLQELAAPDTVIISNATHRLVEGLFNCHALSSQTLRGISTPAPVYRVLSESGAQSRLEVAASRGLTPLVGREQEMGLLLERWEQVKEGLGQVVWLSGEAGIGKSRLVQELKNRVAGEPHFRWECRGSPYHQHNALYPIIDLFQRVLQFQRDDAPEGKFGKLERALAQYPVPLPDVVPLLTSLLSLPLPDRYPPLSQTPQQQKQRTLEALLAMLVELAAQRPVLFIVEDLHWIDSTTQELLSLLIDQGPMARILTVLVSRPEFHLPWASRSHVIQLMLARLPRQQVEIMVEQVAGGKALPAEVRRQIVAKTDGVPLFVEELTKSVLESEFLTQREDHYELTGPLPPLAIPATLHDSLMARLDRLAAFKEVAQLGATVGRAFPYALLWAVSPLDEGTLQQALAHLIEAELLYQRGIPPQATYLFKHALIQDVAYQSLLARRRKELHGAIGQAIEDLHADRLEEQAAILAYHYARSAHQDKAIKYDLLAGDQAARLYANAEATTYYEQALTLAQALPPSPEAQRAQIDAALKLAAVGATRQDFERDQRNLQQVRSMAEVLHDEPRLARVLYWLGRIYYVLGDLPTAISHAQQSLATADRLGNDALAAPPINLMGRLYVVQWDLVQAGQMLARSVEQMHLLGNRTEEATATAYAGYVFGWLGEFERAFSYLDHGLRLAQEIQNPFAEAAAYQYRAQIHDQRGAWARAIADAEEARRVAERKGDLFRVYLVKTVEGRAHTMAGDPCRGRVLLEESIALAEQLGTTFILAWVKAELATCLLALGDREAALPLCHEAIRMAEETHHKFANAIAHRTLAEVLDCLHPMDSQQAERAILEAIRLQQEMGNKPELARSYMSYARLLQNRGEEKARECLTQAIRMFQQMGMAWDLAQSERGALLGATGRP